MIYRLTVCFTLILNRGGMCVSGRYSVARAMGCVWGGILCLGTRIPPLRDRNLLSKSVLPNSCSAVSGRTAYVPHPTPPHTGGCPVAWLDLGPHRTPFLSPQACRLGMPAQVRLPRDLEEGGSERTAVAAGLLKGSPCTNGTVDRRADGTMEGRAANGSYGKHYGSVVSVAQEMALEVRPPLTQAPLWPRRIC
jgi:hypothetical protein